MKILGLFTAVLMLLTAKPLRAETEAGLKLEQVKGEREQATAEVNRKSTLNHHVIEIVYRAKLERLLDQATSANDPDAVAKVQAALQAEDPSGGKARRLNLTHFDQKVIDAHAQQYEESCVPSSVEMVLKLTGREPDAFYDLQSAWKHKFDGSFKDFDGKPVNGVTFHQQYTLARNQDFPLQQEFDTIHRELLAGRFVIVGLASPAGWHNWVVYDEDDQGEFLAVSKSGDLTIKEPQVKKAIAEMQGTDLGTYELVP